MPIDQKINYLEFPAADLDATENFYSKTFAWKFTDYGPEYRAFTDGHMDGGFYKAPLTATTAKGSVLVVLYAKQLEEAQKCVVVNGGQISKAIFTFPGGRRFQFLDPNGNELAVWSDQ